MNRLLLGIVVLGTLLGGSAALAVDTVNQTPAEQRLQSSANHRQIKGCMIKRMVANRTLAYNDAKRACTEQLRAQIDISARPLAAATRSGD